MGIDEHWLMPESKSDSQNVIEPGSRDICIDCVN
jgi:hypothetical protein